MEKLGVETQTPKTASEGTPCPKCGEPAESKGPVILCPTHGSEPFEDERTDSDDR